MLPAELARLAAVHGASRWHGTSPARVFSNSWVGARSGANQPLPMAKPRSPVPLPSSESSEAGAMTNKRNNAGESGFESSTPRDVTVNDSGKSQAAASLGPEKERRSRAGHLSVSRNATLNLLGSVVPMFVTLATVPPYLRLIGDVRFGVLALVWLFLSYFGLFEMGLGRATSKYIAELKDSGQTAREAVFWTAALVNLSVGLVGGLLMWI